MMNTLFVIRLTLLLVFLAAGVPTTAASTRTFDVSDFSGLSVGNAFRITVTQGDGYLVTGTGDQRDLDNLEAAVENGWLTVRYKRNTRPVEGKGIALHIRMPVLKHADFSGATSVEVTGFKEKDKMNVDVSGASSVKMNVIADEVLLELSGASTLALTGHAAVVTGEVSGASALKSKGFEVQDARIEVSGASSAALFVKSSLIAEANGASSIRYSGGVQKVQVNTSGGSSVKKVN